MSFIARSIIFYFIVKKIENSNVCYFILLFLVYFFVDSNLWIKFDSIVSEMHLRMQYDIWCHSDDVIILGDSSSSRLPNQHMLIMFDTRFEQVTNAPVEREHDQNRGQASLASAQRLRGEDYANDSHASGPRRGSSALQLLGTRGRRIGRPGWGWHSSNTLGEACIRGT